MIDWTVATRGVPTFDVLEPLDEDPAQALEDFVWMLQDGTYALWDAVLRDEQGLPLSAAQARLADSLLAFGDADPDERILTINGLERPHQPWHATLRCLAEALLARPPGVASDFDLDGWETLVAAVQADAEPLERPAHAATPLDVLPLRLRDRLALRQVLVDLAAWGQPLDAASTAFAAFLEGLAAQRGPLDRLGVRCADLDALLPRSTGPTLSTLVAAAWAMPVDAPLAAHVPDV